MTYPSVFRGARWLVLVPLLGCGSSSLEAAAASHPNAPASRPLALVTGPELLRDVNARPSPFPRIATSSSGSGGGAVTLANGTAVMALEDHLTGWDLWRSDGTSAGTTLIQDLTPGMLSSIQGPTELTAVGNAAYFFTARSFLGRTGLWKTDGTTPGTLLLQEFEGSEDDSDKGRGTVLPFGSGVLFSFGNALWKTDGTAAGTRELKRFPSWVGPFGHASSGITALGVALDGVALFMGNDPATGMELWKTDGTPEGTVLVKDLVPGETNGQTWRFTRMGQSAFFIGGLAMDQLWRSDGTPEGTTVVYAFPEFRDRINEMTAVGSTLFFSTDRALWKSDGTTAGTGEVQGFNRWDPYWLQTVGSRLFFLAYDDDAGEELWTSDGTPGAASRVADLWPGAGDSQISNFQPWKDHLYFQATPQAGVLGLYKTDGTPAGTTALKTWEGYTGDDAPSSLDLVSLGDSLLFHVEPLSGGTQVWRTDGTVAGTRLLEPLKAGATRSSMASLSNVGELAGHLYFLASEDGQLLSLWKSDGTSAETSRVTTFANTRADLFAEAFATWRVGTRLFFGLEDTTHGAELWRTDGTAAGTARVKDLVPGEDGSDPRNFIEVGGGLLFTAGSYESMQLWKSDGTEAGTVPVPLSDPEAVLNEAHAFTKLGDRVLFAAKNADREDVLWVTDGTTGGTRVLKTFVKGVGVSSTWVNDIAVANGVAILALTEFHQDEAAGDPARLWKTDGTPEGTVQLVPQTFGGLDALAWVNGRLYFASSNPANGWEPWVSDGTAAGTRMLVDLHPGTGSSNPRHFLKLGTTVFFTANDGTHGMEPWVTNGTPEGTSRLADIWPGAESGMRFFVADGTSFLAPLALEDRGLVLFSAAEPGHGAELWRTDGTAAGTSRWVDVLPGPLSSDPSNLARLGDRLFFFAVDEAHGREPWSLSLDFTPTAPDTTAPVLTCPANVTTRASGTDGADVTYAATTVADERGEAVAPTFSQASGTRFPVGDTTVSVTAKDASGNEARCTFQVKVEPAVTLQPPAEDTDDSGGGCSAALTPEAWPFWSLLTLGWTLRRRKGTRGTDA
ncbi:ELWxxDGT repeat protein [Corallococcus terminator]|uniref:HYR domain-containing protein n=1 Tax=Corallococcus terminator TaxID=2316733 RepID=A0A3A8IXZ7_9BACT|nr:ELWxxDGT repeat protein [Corallococcus terminator]RKG88409.1 HYR domain-containing protein [Corallococcus terminator]